MRSGAAPSLLPGTGSGSRSAAYFGRIDIGGALPADAACAAAVRGATEIRPGNAGYNATTWGAWSPTFPRSTGSFTGTTDEIIQWAACKWGFDEDTLRAQVAKESWWTRPTSVTGRRTRRTPRRSTRSVSTGAPASVPSRSA